MYSAFQSNAFQSNAFQIASGGGVPPVVEIGGHFGEDYRKKLKRLAKLADKRLYGQVKREVAVIADTGSAEVAQAAREIQAAIDFDAVVKAESQALAAELQLMLQKLDQLILDAIVSENEDEFILLMVIQ